MKKVIILLFALSIFAKVSAPELNFAFTIYVNEPINLYERLFKAVSMVESSNRPLVVNEKEQAYGIVQIRQIKLDDYNQRTGKSYKLTDCFNVEVSKEIFLFYCTSLDFEEIARSWNGSGKQTDIYWDKVSKLL